MITHFTEEDKKKLQARYAEDQERTFLSYKQYYYDEGREIGRVEGREEGIKQGIEQGAEQEKIAIAKSMLKKKLDINMISEITGLSEEIIRKL